MSRLSDVGVLICLPRYGARIKEVKFGSKNISVNLEAKGERIENIIGKLYYRKSIDVKQKDMQFTNTSGSFKIDFKPDSFFFAIASKLSGELLDSRRFHLGWEMPEGVVFDIPEYGLIELIEHGESETVEFKEKNGKPEEFAETAVSFSNGVGGVILLGVDDNANVVGLSQRNYEDMVSNILRSHCEPKVKYRLDKRELERKEIMLMHVEEGKDKPYTLKGKGVYVRAGATDRVATRYELDEFYQNKQSESSLFRLT